VLVGLLAIFLAVRAIQHSVTQRIEAPQARYRICKLVALGGYLSIVLFISLVFSDQLGHLAVAFGVIGAANAFALQEVIASLGGWVAITLGPYYKLGDRILINGLLGDVIDISPLRTTVMECGGWVGADLHNGRIVRIASGCSRTTLPSSLDPCALRLYSCPRAQCVLALYIATARSSGSAY
jgi:small-conductance mechanosensitive channel